MEQRTLRFGTLTHSTDTNGAIWFNRRADPFERAEVEPGDYVKWLVEHAFVFVPAQATVGQNLQNFQQFPPRQRPGTFTIQQAMKKLINPPSSN